MAEEGKDKGNTAWTFTYHNGIEEGGPGRILGGILIFAGIFAALIGAIRLNRGFSIPLAILGLLGGAFSVLLMQNKSIFNTMTQGNITLSSSPGVGFILMILAFAGFVVLGMLGTVRPERKLSA